LVTTVHLYIGPKLTEGTLMCTVVEPNDHRAHAETNLALRYLRYALPDHSLPDGDAS
jgi:hypothetical protein